MKKVITLLIILLLTGCSAPEPKPEPKTEIKTDKITDEMWDWLNTKPTATPTLTPTATPAPTPTNTPMPTEIPAEKPTATPTEAPIDKRDLDLLAEVMYWENYWNGTEAMLLTGSVVLNRRDYCTWCPGTIEEVLYQKGQYSTTNKFFTEELPAEVYELAEQLLRNGSIAPSNVVFQSMFEQGSGVYKKVGTDYFCYE